MSLQALEFQDTYWSGEDNIIEDFYVPCLRESTEYCRAVGYFSSSILCYISNGLYELIRNGGKMRIVCSVNLSEQDEHDISLGYDIRKIVDRDINAEVEKLVACTIPNVKNLCWLVKNGRLDIKVCLRKNKYRKEYGLFHEKFGIFKDDRDNAVSFLGSVNETLSGWLNNEESFEVSQSWVPVLSKRVQEKVQRFENLWDGTADSVLTYTFPEAARKKLIQHAPEHPVDYTYQVLAGNHPNFKPRKCQEDAKDFFLFSGFSCLFMMATGAGKTKAALYAMSQIDKWNTLLIAVPSLELVEQWESDVRLFYPEVLLIKCGSTHPEGRRLLLTLAQAKFSKKCVIISTYDSAVLDYFMDKWESIKPESLAMICDEVHNMGAKSSQRLMRLNPSYRIGLSATPKRNFDEEGSNLILEYFQNHSFEFSIKEAQRARYLVEYEYHVIPTPMDDCDWQSYKTVTQTISKCKSAIKSAKKKENSEKYVEKLKEAYRDRAKILKMNPYKQESFESIYEEIPEEARVLIYGDDLAHLREFSRELTRMGKDHFFYTGEKSADKERPIMLREFQQGIRKTLLAVGCLDEGVDIPACDVAVFVSSSTSERQYIQRRGRVLRTAPNKRQAWVYDYLVYPILDGAVSDEERNLAISMIVSQYNRINMVADDAINGVRERGKLDEFLSKRRLNPYDF